LSAIFFVAFVVLAPGAPAESVEQLQSRLEVAAARLEADAGAALRADVQVVLSGSTDEFVARSGRSRREAAAWADGRLFLQPLPVLARIRDLDGVLRHELAHALVEQQWRRCPPGPTRRRWLQEGLAMLLAEMPLVIDPGRDFERLDEARVEAALAHPRDDAERAWAYEAARRLVSARSGRALLQHCPP
jgi:hypothetical protein